MECDGGGSKRKVVASRFFAFSKNIKKEITTNKLADPLATSVHDNDNTPRCRTGVVEVQVKVEPGAEARTDVTAKSKVKIEFEPIDERADAGFNNDMDCAEDGPFLRRSERRPANLQKGDEKNLTESSDDDDISTEEWESFREEAGEKLVEVDDDSGSGDESRSDDSEASYRESSEEEEDYEEEEEEEPEIHEEPEPKPKRRRVQGRSRLSQQVAEGSIKAVAGGEPMRRLLHNEVSTAGNASMDFDETLRMRPMGARGSVAGTRGSISGLSESERDDAIYAVMMGEENASSSR